MTKSKVVAHTCATVAHVSPIKHVAIADIVIGERIGFFNEDHARRIGESMAAEGQHAPIQLKRNGNAAKQPWTLVAGLHRVRGAEFNGWSHIAAVQVADVGADEADLRRLELSENLIHRFRRPIERAIMMAEYARLEEAVDHPGKVGESQQARGGRMKNSAAVTMAAADCWRERTAKAFGCSVRSLERHQRIHREIVEAMPDLAQALNDHPMGESLSAMATLAALKHPERFQHTPRRLAATKLLERNDWKSISEVLVAAGINASTGNRVDARNHLAVLDTTWEKMGPREKRSYLDNLPRRLTEDMARRLVTNLMKEFGL